MNYHADLEANRAASREYSRKRYASKRGAKVRTYTKCTADELSLKEGEELEVSEDCIELEFDRRRQNLENIISKIAQDIDAAHAMLELHQGESGCQDSGDLASNNACQVEYKGDLLPDTVYRTEISVQRECETSSPRSSQVLVNEDTSLDPVPNNIAQQFDTTFLAKTQQKVEEMLRQAMKREIIE